MNKYYKIFLGLALSFPIWIVIFQFFLPKEKRIWSNFSSCEPKQEERFVPNPRFDFNDTLYIYPDSAIAVVKWYGAVVGEDTSYIYGVTYDSCGIKTTLVINDEDVIGKK